jgi:purine-nucleoside phosphorylase
MLLDQKDEEQYRRRRGIEALGSYDAVIFRLGLKFEWLPNFPPAKPETYGLESLSSVKPYKGTKGDKEILFDSTMMGAPAACFDVEAYLCHSPASEGIGVGYCGALQSGIEIGTIVIPDSARIGEGTSRYYGEEEVSIPHQELVKKLVDATRRFGYEPLVGEIFSTDAAFMETPDFLENLAQQGILGIDMEMSALFSIAKYHGKSAAGILVVSDKPYEGPLHSLSIPFDRTERISEDVVKICIEALAG